MVLTVMNMEKVGMGLCLRHCHKCDAYPVMVLTVMNMEKVGMGLCLKHCHKV
jgi:hypothetical protein